MTSVLAYWTLARLQGRVVYAYRAGVVAGLAIAVARILLLRFVWTAVYADSSRPAGRPALEDVLAVLTLAQLQLLVMQPTLVVYLQRRIHEGLIGLDLVRPIPFLGQLVAQQAGANLAFVPFVVGAGFVALAVGQLTLPPTPFDVGAYLVSASLAWIISILIGLVMGLVAFWTVETHGIAVIYTFATQLLGGALVPLALFPDWLRVVADVLPFRAVAALPVSVWTGQATGAAIVEAIRFQVVWIAILAVLAWLVWQRARRVVTVSRG